MPVCERIFCHISSSVCIDDSFRIAFFDFLEIRQNLSFSSTAEFIKRMHLDTEVPDGFSVIPFLENDYSAETGFRLRLRSVTPVSS